LWARALDNVMVAGAGRALVAVLDRSDYEAAGAGDDETEGIVESLRSVVDVDVAVLVRRVARDGRVRASLRSEGFDVSAVAALRGGGGHRQAAGFTTDGDPREVAAWLSTELDARLSTASS
jgi:phosphoesterase RecJ-like protein